MKEVKTADEAAQLELVESEYELLASRLDEVMIVTLEETPVVSEEVETRCEVKDRLSRRCSPNQRMEAHERESSYQLSARTHMLPGSSSIKAMLVEAIGEREQVEEF